MVDMEFPWPGLNPADFEGKVLVSGEQRGQLHPNPFNALMRHTHSMRLLPIRLDLADPENYKALDARKLVEIPPQLYIDAVRNFGHAGVEAMRKALQELLESSN